MKQKDIPIYSDPNSFQELDSIKYPCSTEFMLYNTLTHKYYLTASALQNFGVDVDSSYNASIPSKIEQFIDDVTEDVYGVILRLAPFNFQYNSYLVAQSRSLQYDRYTARKMFEKALLYQADYKVKNVDVRNINGVDIETNSNIHYKVLRRELRHISPKTLDILQGLGLLFNGNIPQKNLINYSEVM